MRYYFLLYSLFIFCNTYAVSGNTLFDNSFVHEIRIEFDSVNWNRILTIAHTNEYHDSVERLYLNAKLTVDGNILKNVGVRMKGASSFSWAEKPPLMIDFNEFSADQEYENLKKINLLNSFNDHSNMRNMLSYDIFRYEGIVVPRVSYANVYINGYHYGVYEVVEHIGKPFLKENFGSKKGNLYKGPGCFSCAGNSSDLAESFELQTNEFENDRSKLSAFISAFKETDLSYTDYYRQISEIFDIEQYLKILAIDRILWNSDTYNTTATINYYMYEDPVSDKIKWLPWDYNFSFKQLKSGSKMNVIPDSPRKMLHKALLSYPEIKSRYIQYCTEIMDDNFAEERLFSVIDTYEALLTDAIANDPVIGYSKDIWQKALADDHTDEYVEKQRNIGNYEKYCSWFGDSIDCNSMILAREGKIDTVIVDNKEQVNVVFESNQITSKYYSGLKSFISNRIDSVKHELATSVTSLPYTSSYNKLSVYPSPANETISINGISGNVKSVKMINTASAQTMYFEYSTELDIKGLNKGVYVLEIQTDNSIYYSQFCKL